MSITLSVRKNFRGGALRLTARAFDEADAALRIEAHDDTGNVANIWIFLNNQPLTAALVEAINGAMAAHPVEMPTEGEAG